MAYEDEQKIRNADDRNNDTEPKDLRDDDQQHRTDNDQRSRIDALAVELADEDIRIEKAIKEQNDIQQRNSEEYLNQFNHKTSELYRDTVKSYEPDNNEKQDAENWRLNQPREDEYI